MEGRGKNGDGKVMGEGKEDTVSGCVSGNQQCSLVCQRQEVENTVCRPTQSIHNSNSILKCLQQ